MIMLANIGRRLSHAILNVYHQLTTEMAEYNIKSSKYILDPKINKRSLITLGYINCFYE